MQPDAVSEHPSRGRNILRGGLQGLVLGLFIGSMVFAISMGPVIMIGSGFIGLFYLMGIGAIVGGVIGSIVGGVRMWLILSGEESGFPYDGRRLQRLIFGALIGGIGLTMVNGQFIRYNLHWSVLFMIIGGFIGGVVGHMFGQLYEDDEKESNINRPE